MQQQTTNKILAAGLAIVALLLVGSHFLPGKKQGAETITVARMRQKILQSGWSSLSPQEMQWVRDIYLRDLTRLDTALAYRYRTAQVRGQQRIANEIANAKALVRAEVTRIESDPNADPTGAQTLINQVMEALYKP